MAKKILKFSVNQLIIDGQRAFKVEDFDVLKREDYEKLDVGEGENLETLVIEHILKDSIDDRFITIYFAKGNKYPYSDKVTAVNLQEYENPRSPDEIEMDKQFFVVIDTDSQRIFISDQRQKINVTSWLSDKLRKEISTKAIIGEKEFIENINSVSEITFGVAPNLLNSGSQDTLSQNLVRDLYSFGADYAEVKMRYRRATMSQEIKSKVMGLIRDKDKFENIVVIGRDDENFESIFNVDKVINKISIEVDEADQTKLLDQDQVFSRLIEKLK